ncbi:SAM-dependent methyltransferase [Geovibrio thiophilus]|uniref:SAM-dependent methyltransferase n=1 Tax=Geovibrio thiophilus TaxID=139438 RepID=A0A410JVM9_9BACT|nr:class I SAM-dependent methyltransferase [Geovibrio thiophilus]QAR32098.1 SAM-dependent methyltransferase [Geovibrio thiophilus]
MTGDKACKEGGFCPVCDSCVSEWLPLNRLVGDGVYRKEPEGRLCPVCASFERTRHFWMYIEKAEILKENTRMLHVAPEKGLEAKLRPMLGKNYITADLLKKNVDYNVDLTDLPFADNSFDFIYCSNVLEHIHNDAKAMSELYRVLEEGGMAYIHVPIDGVVTQYDPSITSPEERMRLYGQAQHVRMYGRDISVSLTRAGFKVEELIMPDFLDIDADLQRYYNCAKREMVHFCYK